MGITNLLKRTKTKKFYPALQPGIYDATFVNHEVVENDLGGYLKLNFTLESGRPFSQNIFVPETINPTTQEIQVNDGQFNYWIGGLTRSEKALSFDDVIEQAKGETYTLAMTYYFNKTTNRSSQSWGFTYPKPDEVINENSSEPASEASVKELAESFGSVEPEVKEV